MVKISTLSNVLKSMAYCSYETLNKTKALRKPYIHTYIHGYIQQIMAITHNLHCSGVMEYVDL